MPAGVLLGGWLEMTAVGAPIDVRTSCIPPPAGACSCHSPLSLGGGGSLGRCRSAQWAVWNQRGETCLQEPRLGAVHRELGGWNTAGCQGCVWSCGPLRRDWGPTRSRKSRSLSWLKGLPWGRAGWRVVSRRLQRRLVPSRGHQTGSVQPSGPVSSAQGGGRTGLGLSRWQRASSCGRSGHLFSTGVSRLRHEVGPLT